MRLPSFLTHCVISVGVIAALGAVPPATAVVFAKHGRPLGRAARTAGVCSDGTTTFTLKSQFDDEPFAQSVGAEFEVDSGVVGQTWHITLTDNGETFFDDDVVTTGPEGALNVTTPNQGTFNVAHTIEAKAVNEGTTCTGQVTDPPLSGR